MKELSEEKQKELKFLTKYYEKEKKHDDEVFLYSTYPRLKPGYYVISNYGQLIRFKSGKHMAFEYDKDGYKRVSLSGWNTDGDRIKMHASIHRLVAWEYCSNEKKCNIVNHLDCDITNNYCENLEWTTVQGNTVHAIEHGLTVRAGCNSNGSKYPEEIILEICKYLEDGLTPLETYRQYYPNSDVTEHSNFYQEIYRIKYDEKYLYPVRSKFNISTEKIYTDVIPWTKEECKELEDLIFSGKTNKEILDYYGCKQKREDKRARRICDKISSLRKKHHIPNPDIERFRKMKVDIYNMICDGKSNRDILSYYSIATYRAPGASTVSVIISKFRKQLDMPNPQNSVDE